MNEDIYVYIYVFRDCTLYEALAALEDDENADPDSVYIEPSDPTVVTDEDLGDKMTDV